MKNQLLACILSFAPATASMAEGVFIERTWTCADWAQYRQSGQADELEEQIVGFFNGVALTSGRDFWQATGPLEPKQVFFWMDRYCADNPLGFIVTGAAALAKERLGDGWNTPPD